MRFLVTLYNPQTKVNVVFIAEAECLSIDMGIISATDVYGCKHIQSVDYLVSISAIKGNFTMDLD